MANKHFLNPFYYTYQLRFSVLGHGTLRITFEMRKLNLFAENHHSFSSVYLAKLHVMSKVFGIL